MAKRRMFSLDIVDTDKFTEMPTSTQALYFHLGMRADDDGFLSSPKKVMRSLGFSDDEMKILIAKEFVHIFESGVCVVLDWKMNNYIQKDRYTKSIHLLEKSSVSEDENGSYLICNQQCDNNVKIADTKCIQVSNTLDTQVRLGEVSIGKESIGKKRKEKVTTRIGDAIYGYGLSDKVISALILFDDHIFSLGDKFMKTNLSWKIILNKVKSMCDSYGEDSTIDQINSSIISNWKDIYEPKGKTKTPYNNQQLPTQESFLKGGYQ